MTACWRLQATGGRKTPLATAGMTVHTAYIGLGSNLGNRATSLQEALQRLDGEAIDVGRVSSVYESAPLGPIEQQPSFLNAVAEVTTTLAPVDLLSRCLAVEEAMGRRRVYPKGPRTIDLDLLLVDSLVGRWPGLELPHAALLQRAFVLRPLLELAPALIDPRGGLPVERSLAEVADQRLVRLGELGALVSAERERAAAAAFVSGIGCAGLG